MVYGELYLVATYQIYVIFDIYLTTNKTHRNDQSAKHAVTIYLKWFVGNRI